MFSNGFLYHISHRIKARVLSLRANPEDTGRFSYPSKRYTRIKFRAPLPNAESMAHHSAVGHLFATRLFVDFNFKAMETSIAFCEGRSPDLNRETKVDSFARWNLLAKNS